ncbi:MAG: cyclic nucleotide-binding domain-containing protein [Rhodoferax sp.]|nr:cyclic nucleotide-binding domain-containing protein [Rhodoferax sp.]
MKIDPAIVQLSAENVRAQVLPRAVAVQLDPAMVQKIRQRVPIFSGMSADCLTRTLALAQHFSVPAGAVVCAEGELGDAFYVLIGGQVRIEKGPQTPAVELARLAPGHCFGEMALVGRRVRSATVRALKDSNIMRFDRAQVDANPESAHIIYRNIAGILASRLECSSEQLADLRVRGQHI